MFRLSASAEYSLLLAKYLLENPGVRTLETVSEATGIPLPMLRKVSAKLEKGGVVSSRKGRSGGISATKDGFSVKEVLVAAGENLSIAMCSEKACEAAGGCSIAPTVRNLQRGFDSILSITRL